MDKNTKKKTQKAEVVVLEDNDSKWSSIELLINYLAGEEQQFDKLQEKIFETPVTLSEKYDGTNVGVCEEGKLYGRNKLIPPTEKAYQKVDLQQVRDIDVGPIKAEFAKMIGVENDQIQKFVLYGELMCLDVYLYNKEGLTKSYQMFGAVVKVDENQYQEIADKAREAGFSVVPRTNRLMIPFNGKFMELVKKFGLKTVPLVGEYKSLFDAVIQNKEWMLKGMGEGRIVVSKNDICKWKIGAEKNKFSVESLERVIGMLQKDTQFLGSSNQKAQEFFRTMLEIQLSVAQKDEYEEAVKSAISKFDSHDKFDYDEYVDMISKECLTDIQLGEAKNALNEHKKKVVKVLKKMKIVAKKVLFEKPPAQKKEDKDGAPKAAVKVPKKLDLDSIEEVLETQQWLGGNAPSSLDKEAFDTLKDQVPNPDTHPNVFAWMSVVWQFSDEVKSSWS